MNNASFYVYGCLSPFQGYLRSDLTAFPASPDIRTPSWEFREGSLGKEPASGGHHESQVPHTPESPIGHIAWISGLGQEFHGVDLASAGWWSETGSRAVATAGSPCALSAKAWRKPGSFRELVVARSIIATQFMQGAAIQRTKVFRAVCSALIAVNRRGNFLKMSNFTEKTKDNFAELQLYVGEHSWEGAGAFHNIRHADAHSSSAARVGWTGARWF